MYDEHDAAGFDHHGIGERFKQAVSWGDTISSLIEWFGWRPLIASVALAVIGWAWGYIRNEPVVTLTMSAISVLVALAYLSKLPVICSLMAGRPNADIWRHVDPITLWQAACLLAGISPPNTMAGWFPSKDADAHYAAMVTAVKYGELEKAGHPALPEGMQAGTFDGINFGTFITRASLQKYAAKKGFKARFLEQ